MDHEQLKERHGEHHMGVEKTWFLAKKVDGSVDKKAVKRVVRQCQQCQSMGFFHASTSGVIVMTF